MLKEFATSDPDAVALLRTLVNAYIEADCAPIAYCEALYHGGVGVCFLRGGHLSPHVSRTSNGSFVIWSDET